MSGTPWTPGPWLARHRSPGASSKVAAMRVWTENWVKVASITDTGATTQANARLIQHAPEMADALEAFVMAADLPGDHCEVQQAAIVARALLARIRGDAP